MAWWDQLPQASPLDAALAAEGVTGPLAQLAQSVYMQESSGGRNTQTSNAGAVGGMQILPGTFAEVADDGWDINDPVMNARAGIRYLKKMQELGGGDPRMAAIGYYGGPGAIQAARRGVARSDPRNPGAPNTFEYADQVLGRTQQQPGPVMAALDRASQAVVPAAQASGNWWESMPIAEPEQAPQVAQPNWWDAAPIADPGMQSNQAIEQAQPAAQAQSQPSGGGIMAGIGMGLRDPIDAGAQMLRRAVPEPVGQAVDQFGNMLADAGLPVARSEGVQGVDNIINQVNADYEAARAEAGRDGIDWARLGGNIAGLAPAAYATPQALASGLGRLGAGAVQGAAFGALQPVVGERAQDRFGQSKAMQAGVGGALGAALPAAGSLLAPAASRATSAAQRLAGEGVQLTPGQAVGGMAMRMEDRLMSMPIMGDAIRAARTRGNESLNRAVYNRVLSPIGEKTDKMGRAAVDEARRKISQAYDDVLDQVTFTPDNAFAQNIADLRNMAQALPAKERRAFEGVLQREVLDPLSKGRAIDGRAFKDIETQLGNQAQKYRRSTDAYQQDVGNAIGELQNALRENLMRMNPQQAERLRNVNEAFANFVRLENAAGRIGAQDGVFTPQQLASAIRQTDRSTRRGAYARGDALMQDLSDAAQSRMSAQIPDSGTAERLMVNLLAGGAGYMANPLIPGGLAAASVPYLPGVSQAASNAILRRPANAKALADALERLPPGALGALSGAAQ